MLSHSVAQWISSLQNGKVKEWLWSHQFVSREWISRYIVRMTLEIRYERHYRRMNQIIKEIFSFIIDTILIWYSLRFISPLSFSVPFACSAYVWYIVNVIPSILFHLTLWTSVRCVSDALTSYAVALFSALAPVCKIFHAPLKFQ